MAIQTMTSHLQSESILDHNSIAPIYHFIMCVLSLGSFVAHSLMETELIVVFKVSSSFLNVSCEADSIPKPSFQARALLMKAPFGICEDPLWPPIAVAVNCQQMVCTARAISRLSLHRTSF